PGGGGGGGCGGASVGLWVTGNGLVDVGGWESENTFGVGIGGLAGQGGGGGAAAEDGEAGGAVDVLVR
ncbi:MAG TPA: hypothetical protein RMG95_25475, partial [Polyangiaceae bacterium LLY-WYZ-15_(1-7)]|nr:hypothetical protein [Polyangiaceae bacterium LLY-WYZ-15_(1-7)]